MSTTPLESQVGGHAGVMSSDDGCLIIKPCLPVEREFYQIVNSKPEYATLKSLIPTFLGTLTLAGKVDPKGDGTTVTPLDEDNESIVLENVSASFKYPNIMDVKLGTVLHEETASEEKKTKMEKIARETTSHESGIRLTGFQVYDLMTKEPVHTEKAYGKSIKVAQLPEGIAKFFPLAPSSSSLGVDSRQGLPKDLLIAVLEGIKSRVQRIRDVLAVTELTMVGGSILMVYEADLDKVREGLEHWKNRSGDSDSDEEEDSDEEDEDDSEGSKRPPKPFAVKLIDFAHAHFVPGQGPDHRVLIGIDTTLKLLQGRIEEVHRS